MPRRLKKSDGVEIFIQKCDKYFKIIKMNEADKEIIIECFLDNECL